MYVCVCVCVFICIYRRSWTCTSFRAPLRRQR